MYGTAPYGSQSYAASDFLSVAGISATGAIGAFVPVETETLAGLYATGSVTDTALDLNFITSGVDSRLTTTRASNATYFDSTGTLQTAASNTARIDYGYNAGNVTNWLRNSSMVGAVAGTPGTAPTNWFIPATATGLTATIIGSGTTNGLPYIDVSYVGTATATATVNISYETSTFIAAAIGQTWTSSAYLQLISGALPSGSAFIVAEVNSSGSFLAQGSTPNITPTSSLQRYSATYTTTNAACAFVWTGLYIYYSNGVSYNFTVRIAAPQFELAALVGNLVLTSGSIASSVVTNWIRNSTNIGAVSGTPGTLPNNWSTLPIGLSQQVIGTGTINGLRYIDIRFFGTATGQFESVFLDTATGIPAAMGETWTMSCYAAMVGGSTTNVAATGIFLWDVTSSGGYGSGAIGIYIGITSTLTRYTATGITSDVTVAYLQPRFFFNCLHGSGDAIDITLRLAAPQVEQFAAANTFVPTSGSVVTTGAAPLGLLVEEARSNQIRNPRAEGAVVGSPGTAPTYWQLFQATGLSTQVIATGVENGLPFCDVRFYGTPSVTGVINIFNEGFFTTPASVGQNWTISMYLRLVNGAWTNVSPPGLVFAENNSGGTFLSGQSYSVATPTNVGLTSQRVSATRTLQSATTATIYTYLLLGVTSGLALDFTLRCAGPQLELGLFPTSLILPTAGSPAASSRAAELVSMPTTGWYSSAATSVEVEFIKATATDTGYAGLFELDDGTFNNRFAMNVNPSSAIVVAGDFYSSNITDAAGTLGTSNIGVSNKAGFVVNASTMYSALNGVAGFTAIPAHNVAGLLTRLTVGSCGTGNYLNGYVRRLRYWPRVLPTSQLLLSGDATSETLSIATGTLAGASATSAIGSLTLVPSGIISGVSALASSTDTTLDFNFLSGLLDPRIGFARTGATATYFDLTGTQQTAGANVPRFDYNPTTLLLQGLLVEETRTNYIRNPRAEGIVAGTPGTIPTDWGIGISPGLTQQVLGTVTINGINCFRVRFFGTTSASNSVTLVYFENSGAILSGLGYSATYTQSLYMALHAGSLSGLSTLFWGQLFNNLNAVVVDSQPSTGAALTSTLTRYTNTQTTPASGSSPFHLPSAGIIIYTTANTAYDFTLDIAEPQIEIGPFVTSAILPPAGSPGVAIRGFDSLSMPVSGWFNSAVGSFASQVTFEDATLSDSNYMFFSLNNNGTPVINAYIGATARVAFEVSGASGLYSANNVVPLSGTIPAAFSYSASTVAYSVAGVNGSGAGVAVPTITTLDIGAQSNTGSFALDGHIQRMRYWPRVLSSAELQSETSALTSVFTGVITGLFGSAFSGFVQAGMLFGASGSADNGSVGTTSTRVDAATSSVGVSASGAVGLAIAKVSATPAGVFASNAVGAFAISFTDGTIGVYGTASPGIATTQFNIAIAGQNAVAATGTPIGSVFAFPLGVFSTGAVGVSTFTFTFGMVGDVATGAVGLLIPSVAALTLGNAIATGVPGQLSDIQTGQPTGVFASGAVGLPTTFFLIGVQGDSAIGIVGIPIPGPSSFPVGVFASGQVTTETSALSTGALPGASGISAPGGFALSGFATDTGIAALGAVASGVPSVAPNVGGVNALAAPGALSVALSIIVGGVFATGTPGIGVPAVQPNVIGDFGAGFVGAPAGLQTSVLTGVSSLGVVGVETTALSLVDTGVAGSGAVGIPFGRIDAGGIIAGPAASGAVGSLSNEVDATGGMVFATGTVGLLISIPQIQLAGVNATTGVGLAIAWVSAVPLGVSGSGVVGVFTTTATANPLADFATGAVGPAYGAVAAALTGVYGTGVTRDPIFILGAFGIAACGLTIGRVSVTGSSAATGATGLLTTSFLVGLSGVQSAASIGVPIPEVDDLSPFAAATSAIGLFDTRLISAQPLGVSAISAIGIASTAFLVFLSGVNATAANGSAAISTFFGVSGDTASGAVGAYAIITDAFVIASFDATATAGSFAISQTPSTVGQEAAGAVGLLTVDTRLVDTGVNTEGDTGDLTPEGFASPIVPFSTAAIGIVTTALTEALSGLVASGAISLATTDLQFAMPFVAASVVLGVLATEQVTVASSNAFALGFVDDLTTTTDADDTLGQSGDGEINDGTPGVNLYQFDIPWMEGDTNDFTFTLVIGLVDSLFAEGDVGLISPTAFLNGQTSDAAIGDVSETIILTSGFAHARGMIHSLGTEIDLTLDASAIAAQGAIDIAPADLQIVLDATLSFGDAEIGDLQYLLAAQSADVIFAEGAVGVIASNVNLEGVWADARSHHPVAELDVSPDMSVFAAGQISDFAFTIDVPMSVSAVFVAGAIGTATNDNTTMIFMGDVFSTGYLGDTGGEIDAADFDVVDAGGDGEIGSLIFEYEAVMDGVSANGIALDLVDEIDIVLDASLIVAFGTASIDPTFLAAIAASGSVSADGEVGIATITEWVPNGVAAQTAIGALALFAREALSGQAASGFQGQVVWQVFSLYYQSYATILTGSAGNLVPLDTINPLQSVATGVLGSPSFHSVELVALSGAAAIATVSGANLGSIVSGLAQAVFATTDLGVLAEPIGFTMLGASAQAFLGLSVPETDAAALALPLFGQVGALTRTSLGILVGSASIGQTGLLSTMLVISMAGVLASAQAGAVVAQIPSHTLQGQFMTGGLGAAAIIVTDLVIGDNATGGIGSLADTLPLLGLSALAVESTPFGAPTALVSGLAASAISGGLLDTLRLGMLGTLATGAVGSIAQGAAQVDVGSLFATGRMGSLNALDTVAVIGAEADTDVGSLFLSSQAVLAGLSVLGQVGALTFSTPSVVLGESAMAIAGNLATMVGVQIAGAFGEADYGLTHPISTFGSGGTTIGLSSAMATARVGGMQPRDTLPLSGVASRATAGSVSPIASLIVGQAASTGLGTMGHIALTYLAGVFGTAVTTVISVTGGLIVGQTATSMTGYFLPPLVDAYPLATFATAIPGLVLGYQQVFAIIGATLPLPIVIAAINGELQFAIFATLPAPLVAMQVSIGTRPIVPAGHPVSVYSMPQIVDVTYAVAGGYTDSYGRSQLSRKHR